MTSGLYLESRRYLSKILRLNDIRYEGHRNAANMGGEL
jgi:hypothetical protein